MRLNKLSNTYFKIKIFGGDFLKLELEKINVFSCNFVFSNCKKACLYSIIDTRNNHLLGEAGIRIIRLRYIR